MRHPGIIRTYLSALYYTKKGTTTTGRSKYTTTQTTLVRNRAILHVLAYQTCHLNIIVVFRNVNRQVRQYSNQKRLNYPLLINNTSVKMYRSIVKVEIIIYH